MAANLFINPIEGSKGIVPPAARESAGSRGLAWTLSPPYLSQSFSAAAN